MLWRRTKVWSDWTGFKRHSAFYGEADWWLVLSGAPIAGESRWHPCHMTWATRVRSDTRGYIYLLHNWCIHSRHAFNSMQAAVSGWRQLKSIQHSMEGLGFPWLPNSSWLKIKSSLGSFSRRDVGFTHLLACEKSNMTVSSASTEWATAIWVDDDPVNIHY